MDKTIGWGIIGPGRIAYEFAESLRVVPGTKLAAVGSRSMERATKFSSIYGGNPYGSYREMLKDPEVDIVYVATPHNFHEEQTILCADAGKAILCEKPFTYSRESAQKMIDAAKKNNVLLMECLWARFFPLWLKAIEMIDSGAIGEIRVIESAMSWGSQTVEPSDRLYDPALAGGSLLDAGAYPMSAIFMIMKGRLPSEIKGMYHLCETGVDDDCAVMFRYDKPEAFALWRCGLRSNGYDTSIIGSKGTLILERHDHPSRMIFRRYEQGAGFPRQDEIIEIPYRTRGFQYIIEAALECFREGKKECALTPWQQTLDIAKILEDLRHEAGVWYPFEMKR